MVVLRGHWEASSEARSEICHLAIPLTQQGPGQPVWTTDHGPGLLHWAGSASAGATGCAAARRCGVPVRRVGEGAAAQPPGVGAVRKGSVCSEQGGARFRVRVQKGATSASTSASTSAQAGSRLGVGEWWSELTGEGERRPASVFSGGEGGGLAATATIMVAKAPPKTITKTIPRQ